MNTQARKGQLQILIYGAEKFGIAPSKSELDARNYHLTFCSFESERRFNEFDGVIIFQRLFETYVTKEGWDSYYTVHDCIRDELDKRQKELELLLAKGGFACFLLHKPFLDHIYESGYSTHCTDTDLVKRVLNFSSFYREDLNNRLASIECIRDEFNRFFELYGAARTYFSNYNQGIEWRVIATTGREAVAFILWDKVFIIPCLLPNESSSRKEEFFRLLTEALVSTVKKLSIELPSWLESYKLPPEEALDNERQAFINKLSEIDKEKKRLQKYKKVLLGSGEVLVSNVVNLLNKGFGFRVSAIDQLREDITFLDEDDNPLIFGEIKGTNRGVKREFLNQADTHRERSGLDAHFPSLLIVNTHIRNARGIGEKDQPVASEQIKHAVKMHILILRTLDLIRLFSLFKKQIVTTEQIMALFRSETGWLQVDDNGFTIVQE